jgi:hypothetical protein
MWNSLPEMAFCLPRKAYINLREQVFRTGTCSIANETGCKPVQAWISFLIKKLQ